MQMHIQHTAQVHVQQNTHIPPKILVKNGIISAK
jgi:hypothetical protein